MPRSMARRSRARRHPDGFGERQQGQGRPNRLSLGEVDRLKARQITPELAQMIKDTQAIMTATEDNHEVVAETKGVRDLVTDLHFVNDSAAPGAAFMHAPPKIDMAPPAAPAPAAATPANPTSPAPMSARCSHPSPGPSPSARASEQGLAPTGLPVRPCLLPLCLPSTRGAVCGQHEQVPRNCRRSRPCQ